MPLELLLEEKMLIKKFLKTFRRSFRYWKRVCSWISQRRLQHLHHWQTWSWHSGDSKWNQQTWCQMRLPYLWLWRSGQCLRSRELVVFHWFSVIWQRCGYFDQQCGRISTWRICQCFSGNDFPSHQCQLPCSSHFEQSFLEEVDLKTGQISPGKLFPWPFTYFSQPFLVLLCFLFW